MHDHHSDKALLAASDDEASFRQLYDRYWESLYDKALGRLGSDADAQDTVQEVFISLWRNRHTVQVEESLAPYLHTALKYAIIKRLHRESKKARNSIHRWQDWPIPNSAPRNSFNIRSCKPSSLRGH